jgi:hypothetical protein
MARHDSALANSCAGNIRVPQSEMDLFPSLPSATARGGGPGVGAGPGVSDGPAPISRARQGRDVERLSNARDPAPGRVHVQQGLGTEGGPGGRRSSLHGGWRREVRRRGRGALGARVGEPSANDTPGVGPSGCSWATCPPAKGPRASRGSRRPRRPARPGGPRRCRRPQRG